MNRWLKVVGIGDDGLAGLTPAARSLVDQAEVIVGGERHLNMLVADGRERISWPKPFDTMSDRLCEYRGRSVCVLATGDPCCHGVGSLLAQHIGVDELQIVPAPSAYSLACAKLGWSLTAVETLSLHGRPLAQLHPFVQPDAKLLVLSENAGTVAQIARLLCERGYEQSKVTVLSHLGGEAESRVDAPATDWGNQSGVGELNTVAIECVASEHAQLLPRSPGLPDDAFEHDGKLSKREVRAVSLAALAPVPGQLLWDIGAGCGSIGIEWMRAASRARAIAIEPELERLRMIAANATALGTPALEIVAGKVTDALEGLERPDAIFVGGGITSENLRDKCWDALKPGGRLVANAVSVEGERLLDDWHQALGGQLIRLSVARAEPIGRFRGWRPMMPVTQLCVTKAGPRTSR